MTQVADPGPRSDRPSPDRPHDVCPFLLAESAWRSAAPTREHRCLALGPDLPLALDKQQRLCLTAGHRSCPAYRAAVGAEAAETAPARRPYPRMAPVVVDRGGIGVLSWVTARDRSGGQLALGALMVLAFVAIALARFTGTDEGGLAAGAASLSPEATSVAARPSTIPGTPATPSTSPSAMPSQAATAAPSSTPRSRTYKVKRGDTLIAIAARFDTTVREIVRLNDIENPSRIPVGAVLQIPPEAAAP